MTQSTPDELSADLQSLRIDRSAAAAPRRWPKVFAALAALGALAAVVVWVALPRLSAAVFRTEVEVTEISLVSPTGAATELTATGYLVPQRTSKVGAKVPGRLAEVLVEEGDRVEQGQVIARLEAADRKSAVAAAQARVASAIAQVHSARASLIEAKLKADRQAKLVARGVAPKATAEDLKARADALAAQVAAAEAEVRAAQAEVQSRRVDLGYTEVTSPIAGTVLTKPAAVGELLGLESSILELADLDSVLVEADVAEARLSLVQPKAPAEIILDAYPGRRYRGEVAQISPQLNRAKATATVKVRFVDRPADARPEMAARVNFLSRALTERAIQQAPKVVVPAAAVVERRGANVVFVIDGDRVRLRSVELGPAVVGGREVVNGPAAGTRVVKNPPAELSDGQKIKEKSG